jgi:hypothetical protein
MRSGRLFSLVWGPVAIWGYVYNSTGGSVEKNEFTRIGSGRGLRKNTDLSLV